MTQSSQNITDMNTKLQNPKGLASYCKAETTFTFHFPILTLSSAFLSINNREMKSESGFSFAMASKPLYLMALILCVRCML